MGHNSESGWGEINVFLEKRLGAKLGQAQPVTTLGDGAKPDMVSFVDSSTSWPGLEPLKQATDDRMRLLSQGRRHTRRTLSKPNQTKNEALNATFLRGFDARRRMHKSNGERSSMRGIKSVWQVTGPVISGTVEEV